MGSITEKLMYTLSSVDDIQTAINECKVECGDDIALEYYGDKIREIKNADGNNVKDFYVLEKVTGWTQNDILVKDIEDVTESLIVGSNGDLTSREYYALIGVTGFNEQNIIALPVTDVSNQFEY